MLQAGDPFWAFCDFDGMRAFLHFVCGASLFCLVQKVGKEGVHHLVKEFLKLRILNALMLFSARCIEEVLNWFDILLSLSGSRSSAGNVCMFHPEPRP